MSGAVERRQPDPLAPLAKQFRTFLPFQDSVETLLGMPHCGLSRQLEAGATGLGVTHDRGVLQRERVGQRLIKGEPR